MPPAPPASPPAQEGDDLDHGRAGQWLGEGQRRGQILTAQPASPRHELPLEQRKSGAEPTEGDRPESEEGGECRERGSGHRG